MRVNTGNKSSLECISSERTPPHKAFGRRKQTFPNRSDYPVQGMFQRFGRKGTLSKMSCRRRTGMGKRLLRHDFSEGFQGKSRFPDAVTQSGEDPKKNQTALSGSSFLPDSLKTEFRAARENAPPLRLKLPFSSANGFFRKASGTADRKALPKRCFEESDEDGFPPVLFHGKISMHAATFICCLIGVFIKECGPFFSAFIRMSREGPAKPQRFFYRSPPYTEM